MEDVAVTETRHWLRRGGLNMIHTNTHSINFIGGLFVGNPYVTRIYDTDLVATDFTVYPKPEYYNKPRRFIS